MVQTAYETKDGQRYVIHLNGYNYKKKCWITTAPTNDEKKLQQVAKEFCKQKHMKFINGKMAKPYEMNPWQHTPMFVFTSKCTNKTPTIYTM